MPSKIVDNSRLPVGQIGLERSGHNFELRRTLISKVSLCLGQPKTLAKTNFTTEPYLTALPAKVGTFKSELTSEKATCRDGQSVINSKSFTGLV